jgi:large subunit ribosomal protein L15
MPLQRRLPKRGFFNKYGKEYRIVSLDQIDSLSEVTEITNANLIQAGFIKKGQLSKVLANGEIKRAVTLCVDRISGQAKNKIESAGGTVKLVEITEA